MSFDFNEGDDRSVLVRFGVSFLSTEQACSNAESEIPDWDWGAVQSASVDKWEDVLSRVEINTTVEDPTVVELLYSSVKCHDLAIIYALISVHSYTVHNSYRQI